MAQPSVMPHDKEKQPARFNRLWAVFSYGFATALPRLSGAILALLYTSVFSLEEYGAFGVLSVTILPLSALMDMGNLQAIMRNYYDHQHDWNTARRFLANVIFSSDVVALLIFPLLVTGLYFSWDFFDLESNHVLFYVTIVVGIALLDRSVTMLSVVLRVVERPYEYAWGPIADSVTSIACGILFVIVLDWGVMGAMLAAGAGRLVSFIVHRAIVQFRLNIRGGHMDWTQIQGCFSFGLPLLLAQLANWVRESGLRPILALVAPLGSIGLFSLASSIASLPLLASVAIDMALSPYYLKQRTSQSKDFERRMYEFGAIFLAVLAPIWAALILFSVEFIGFFASERYAAAAPICSILLCASFARMQQPFFIRQLHYLRRTWLHSSLTIPLALCSISISVILTANFGILYAAWGVLVIEFGCLIGFGLIISRFESLHYPMLRSTCLLAALSLMALANMWEIWAPLTSTEVILGKLLILATVTIFSVTVWIWPKRQFIAAVISR